jgi:hypothetical protein
MITGKQLISSDPLVLSSNFHGSVIAVSYPGMIAVKQLISSANFHCGAVIAPYPRRLHIKVNLNPGMNKGITTRLII